MKPEDYILVYPATRMSYMHVAIHGRRPLEKGEDRPTLIPPENLLKNPIIAPPSRNLLLDAKRIISAS
jgi:hypothetical protein